MLMIMKQISFHLSLRRAGLLAVLLLFAAPLRAQDTPATPPPTELQTVQSYGAKNPDCLEWTDTCAVCKRGDDGKVACSTPGIACTQQPIVCGAQKAGTTPKQP
jgi:hypothetical protein